jgi:hypothetical protein
MRVVKGEDKLNLNDNPTIEQFRDLLRAHDDHAGHHVLWVRKDGEVMLTCLPKSNPRRPPIYEHPQMQMRYDTFPVGYEYVGLEAAEDKCSTSGAKPGERRACCTSSCTRLHRRANWWTRRSWLRSGASGKSLPDGRKASRAVVVPAQVNKQEAALAHRRDFDLFRPRPDELNCIRGAFERFGWERLGNTAYPPLGEPTETEDWFNRVVPALMLLRAYCRFATADQRGIVRFTVDAQTSTGFNQEANAGWSPLPAGDIDTPNSRGRVDAWGNSNWLDGIGWPYAAPGKRMPALDRG